jgi:hypothetical protein
VCVIFIADKVRPTPDMVEKAWDRNPKGAGIAWRQDGEVLWRKGLDLDEVAALIAKVPMPFISHFRVDTCGGDGPNMTHPFQVDVNSSIELKGKTKGYMMFHNGHWGQWKNTLMETCLKTGQKLPGGRWTDSRAMAFVAAVYGGVQVLELIDEKSAVLSPTDIQVFGNGWSRVNDVICSNDFWKHAHNPSKRIKGNDTKPVVVVPERVVEASTTKETDGKAGGTSQVKSFRRNDETLQRGEDQPETVEEGTQGRGRQEASAQASEATVEDKAADMIEWVRSQNPSPYRRSLRPEDEAERDRRIDDARRGIVHLGPM